MDLPDKHPAGGETASATADGRSVLPAEKPFNARENLESAPVIGRIEPTHDLEEGNMGGQGLRRFFLGAPSRTDGLSFVFSGMRRTKTGDSTQDGQRSRESCASKSQEPASSPDAQGLGKMTKRTLSSIGAIAGVGVLSLALHSCGQKPPTDETAEVASAATQAMRVTQ